MVDDSNEGEQDALDKLVAAFPRIFATGRPMGSYVSAGWVSLVHDLLVKLDRELADGQAFEVLQIKEKFGSLRFYWRLDEESTLVADLQTPEGPHRLNIEPEETSETFSRIKQLVAGAERASRGICEQCSQPGTLDKSGWWSVRCRTCSQAQ